MSSALRQRTRPGSTPAALRRLGAAGLLAGGLVGVGGFAAGTVAASDAQSAANAATAHDALDVATAAGARARVEAAQAVASRSSTTTSAQALTRMDTSLATVAEGLSVGNASADDALGQGAADLIGYRPLVEAARTDGSSSAVQKMQDREGEWSTALTRAEQNRRSEVASEETGRTWALTGGVAAGVLGTAVLAGTAVWLARRTRRVVNPPLVGATLLGAAVLVGTVASVGAAGSTIQEASRVTNAAPTSRHLVETASTLRESQLDALLNGSTAAASSPDRTTLDTEMNDAGSEARSAWATYAASYDKTANLMASNRSGAIAEATTNGATAYQSLMSALDDASPSWSSARRVSAQGAGVTPWLLLGGGLIAGGLAVFGTGRRLEEYR